MTRDEAFTRLRRVIGPQAAKIIGAQASSPERRAAAKAECEALTEQLEALKSALRAKADEFRRRPEVVRLEQQITRLEQQRAAALDRANYYRFQIGEDNGLFHVERAKGDTWEEVFARLAHEDHSQS